MKEPDWRLIAYALCIKYGTSEGVAVVGDGTLSWVEKYAEKEIERDTSAFTLRWKSPPLNALSERAP